MKEIIHLLLICILFSCSNINRDNSLNKKDSCCDGEPMYFVNVLRESLSDLDTDEYKYKMKIVEFLKNKGIDYRSIPIPTYIKNKVKQEYPNGWK